MNATRPTFQSEFRERNRSIHAMHLNQFIFPVNWINPETIQAVLCGLYGYDVRLIKREIPHSNQQKEKRKSMRTQKKESSKPLYMPSI